MKYTIIIQDADGVPIRVIPGCSKREAVRIAKEESVNPDCQVFIEWFRPLDGQRGYLNRDGHAITGKAW